MCFNETKLASPLIKLLHDQFTDVRIQASAALCNLVLDFSPVKQEILDKDGLGEIIALAKSSIPDVRLNGMWALKNVLFLADIKMKKNVIKDFRLHELLQLLKCEVSFILKANIFILFNLLCYFVMSFF